jgi:ParB family chromosome partitioning protein
MNYIEIKTKDCFASPTNPRGDFMKDTSFKDLMSSIKEKGILSPIIVKLVGKKYEVVAGNRRFDDQEKIYEYVNDRWDVV